MACNLTDESLTKAMVSIMRDLSTTGSAISKKSVHGIELTDKGFGTATPRRLYKSFVRFTVNTNGCEDVTWPTKWLKLTIEDLAPRLL